MTSTIVSTSIGHGILVAPGIGNINKLTVTDTGVINSTSYAVYAELYGLGNTVNDGLLNAGKIGVGLVDAGLLNNGSINGGEAGVVLDQGYLINNGRITGGTLGVLAAAGSVASATFTNTGLVYGGVIGLYQGSGMVTNFGTVIGGSVAVAIETGSFINATTGLISGNDTGLSMEGGGAVNAGTINGVFYGAYIFGDVPGVALRNTNNISALDTGVGMGGDTLVNSGSIGGQLEGVHITASSVVAQITDSGIIFGPGFAIDAASALDLILQTGADIQGAVIDRSGNGVLDLTGNGSFGDFSGFSNIDFAARAAWTLEGNVAALASGQHINGFTFGDTLVLEGFAATSETFTGGLVLSNGVISETLGITGNFMPEAIAISNDGPNTTVELVSPAVDISIVSTALPGILTVNSGYVAQTVTVTNTGTVGSFTDVNFGGTLINNGLLEQKVYLALNASLENDGIIEGHGGVQIAASSTIDNTGLISGSFYGILANNIGGVIINSGTIIGGSGAAITGNSSYESPYVFDGIVLNTGSISGEVYGASSLDNSGIITSGSIGTVIYFWGDSVNNRGLIEGQSIGVSLYQTNAGSNSTLSNAGTVSGGIYGVKSSGGAIITSGLITGGLYAIDNHQYEGTIFPGPNSLHLTIDPGAAFSGTVRDWTGQGIIVLGGTGAGSLDMGASFTGFSQLAFSAGADWTLEGSASNLASGQAITGFAAGNTIVLDGFAATSNSFVSGTGLILSNGMTSKTLQITGNLATSDLAVINNGGSTSITEAVACFCTGTRIATSRGDVAVEALAVGDLVKTASQGMQPIRWIGLRAYEGRFIAGNHLALPVRIHRDALGAGVPSRDLCVSPDHALAEGGVLVHAWRFVNGVSITQAEAVERVEYFHIELENHAVIFAENTPVESFLDNGTRARFQNMPDVAGDFSIQAPCLPRVEDGYYLARLKQRIDARAGIEAADALGILRGCIDETGPRLRGWAQNVAAPEQPVELELLCSGAIVLRFLANRYRADLRKAGLGSGCHAFELALPTLDGPLTLRRAADGAPFDQGWMATRRAG